MALAATAVTVGTTATPLTTAGETDQRTGLTAVVANVGTGTVYLGNASVTAAAGYPLDAGNQLAIDLDAGERLHGIVASGTVAVRVLQQGS